MSRRRTVTVEAVVPEDWLRDRLAAEFAAECGADPADVRVTRGQGGRDGGGYVLRCTSDVDPRAPLSLLPPPKDET